MKRIAVFASGRGSNFQAILEQIKKGNIPATIGLCLTNNPKAGVIKIARENKIPIKICSPKEYPDIHAFNEDILNALIELDIDTIKGAMERIKTVRDYLNKYFIEKEVIG